MPDLLTLYASVLQQLWELRLLLLLVFLFLIYRELRRLDRDYRLHALLMSVTFFLIVSAYWILKPLKKGLFLGHYKAHSLELFGNSFTAAQAELYAKEANVLIALLAAVFFTRLARYFRRDHFFTFIASLFFGFFLIFSLTGNLTSAGSAWLFYLSGDLFITMMVAAFFAFLNDSEMPVVAKRLYGIVGLGGTIGGFAGSSLVASHAEGLSVASGMHYACILLVAMIIPVLWVGRIVRRHPPHVHTPEETTPRFTGTISRLFNGIDVVIRSRYLLGILALVAIYEMVSTIVDYQFSATVVHFVEGADLGNAFSRIFTVTNLVAVLVQLLVTRFMLTRFGVGPALALLPLAIVACSIGYLIVPVLIFGALLNTADNGFSYSINQSAKEVLYVPVSPEEKYRAKAFIDIFILRAAKGIAIVLSGIISLWFADFEDIRWLSIGVIAMVAIWLILIRYLDKAYRWREEQA